MAAALDSTRAAEAVCCRRSHSQSSSIAFQPAKKPNDPSEERDQSAHPSAVSAQKRVSESFVLLIHFTADDPLRHRTDRDKMLQSAKLLFFLCNRLELLGQLLPRYRSDEHLAFTTYLETMYTLDILLQTLIDQLMLLDSTETVEFR